MKHRYSGTRLGRNSSLLKATLRDLAKATLVRQRICTTKAKAKEARRLVERLITLGKKGELAQKRHAFSILCDHGVVSDLFNKIAPRFKNRNGGYTRIITLANRRGDNAQMVYLELTEKDETIISKPKSQAVAKTKDIEAKPVETAVKEPQVEKKAAPKVEKPFEKKIAPKDQGKQEKRGLGGGIRGIFKKPSE